MTTSAADEEDAGVAGGLVEASQVVGTHEAVRGEGDAATVLDRKPAEVTDVAEDVSRD